MSGNEDVAINVTAWLLGAMVCRPLHTLLRGGLLCCCTQQSPSTTITCKWESITSRKNKTKIKNFPVSCIIHRKMCNPRLKANLCPKINFYILCYFLLWPSYCTNDLLILLEVSNTPTCFIPSFNFSFLHQQHTKFSFRKCHSF